MAEPQLPGLLVLLVLPDHLRLRLQRAPATAVVVVLLTLAVRAVPVEPVASPVAVAAVAAGEPLLVVRVVMEEQATSLSSLTSKI